MSWRVNYTRASLIFLVAMLFGCERYPTSMARDATATSVSGTDRLSELLLATHQSEDTTTFAFDSLVWEKLVAGTWSQHRRIYKSEIQMTEPDFSMVEDIRLFDAENGVVVWRLALRSEGKSTRYEWSKWDLNHMKILEKSENKFWYED